MIYNIGIYDGKEPTKGNPYYMVWNGMLRRCYSIKERDKFPSYSDCSVCEEWLLFSSFKAWMEQQDWRGKCLDKDIIIRGNKTYSPETCIFVKREINSLFTTRERFRGDFPLGVNFHKPTEKFVAQCAIGIGMQKCLGLYDTPEDAHFSWLKAKISRFQEVINKLPPSESRLKSILSERLAYLQNSLDNKVVITNI